MIFSSMNFILYFLPITVIVYFMFSFSRTLQKIWLLLVSLVFYAWGEPLYVLLLVILVSVNYLMGIVIDIFKKKDNKLLLASKWIAIIVNLLNLFVFKYMNDVIDIINSTFKISINKNTNIMIPIGLSFFTLQAITYIVEISKKDKIAEKNPIDVALYLVFFAKVVAGPIMKYEVMKKDLREKKVIDINSISEGICRFCVGLIKKVLIANNLYVVTSSIYDLTKTGYRLYDVTIVMAWIGAISFMLQIYIDLSAYSDMAIGLGRIFGFKFEENFNYPYISKTITEFWKRWYITLVNWFKEHVYDNLGGANRKNSDYMIRNLLIVFVTIGLWHGLSWTYLIWGLYNFVFIVFEKVIELDNVKKHNVFMLVYTNIVLLFGWVIFRADNLYVMREYFLNMFGLNKNSLCNATSLMMIKEYGVAIICAVIFSTPIYKKISRWCLELTDTRLRIATKVIYVLLMCIGVFISILVLTTGGYKPFIYFKF